MLECMKFSFLCVCGHTLDHVDSILANDDSALPATAPTPAEAHPRRGLWSSLSQYALRKVPLLLAAESAACERLQGAGRPVMQEHSDGVAFLGMD